MGDTELGVGDHARTAKERPSQLRLDAPEIPGYRIDAVLGEGGMGTVYGAEQAAPRRRVAIKVLHGRSASALARFTAEAEIMARLDHPGIARVLEAGEADSHPFLVMEHVDGVTLDRYAKTLSRRERIAVFVALCAAVHHAHVKGVIHRDLKPSNVMVRADGRVIVLDFGVARLAADDTPGPTRAGELVGTPLYMSPEQARLRPDEVDVRTDVYTLGVMLYELACGELPYESRDAPIPILTCMICEDPPVALSKRDPTLRGDLEAIVMKAIAKEPAHRYQSVAAFGDDVRRWLDGLPVSVRMPGAIERARRFVRRRPLVAAAIAGTLGAIAVFAIVVTWLWLDASNARSAAEAASARTEAARAQLEAQTNQLVLRQARATLARDPTEALAWLATLTPRDVDAATAWSIADEAIARGVARDVLRGHADEVHWVESLPGGFVSGGYDGRVIVWDPAQRPIFVAKHGRIHTVRAAPGGGELAIGGDDGALHVISRSGDVRAELVGHVGDVQHVAWTSDGAWLASSDDHGHVFVWPHGRAPGVPVVASDHAIGALTFAGAVLAAADHDGHVWLWNADTGKLVGTAAVGGDVQELWTDGTRVLAATASGAVVTLRQTISGLVVDHSIETKLACKKAAFAPDGSFAVLGGVGGDVSRVEGSVISPIARFTAQVRSLAVSSDGRWIAAGGEDGMLVVHDRATDQHITLRGHTGRIRHIAFAGTDLLSADSDGVVRRWQLGDVPATVLDTGVPSERATATSDMFAWVDAAGEVKSWTLATHRLARLGHVDGRATAIAISAGTVITGSADGVVTWWTGAPVQRGLHAIVRAIVVRDDVVAIASAAGPIALYSPAGEPRGELAGHRGGTDAIALAGDIAVSGGQDRIVRVWRLADGMQLAALDGPRGDTHFVAATERWIASAGNDGNVFAWPLDKLDSKARITLAHHTGAVTALARAGDTIVSAGRDATLARSRLGGGAAQTTTIPMAAVALAVAGDGTIHAVTRSGAVVRWGTSGPAVVEIDHGVRDGAPVTGTSRWIEAFEDGTFVVAESRPRSLDELRAAIAAATTFHVH